MTDRQTMQALLDGNKIRAWNFDNYFFLYLDQDGTLRDENDRVSSILSFRSWEIHPKPIGFIQAIESARNDKIVYRETPVLLSKRYLQVSDVDNIIVIKIRGEFTNISVTDFLSTEWIIED